MAFVCPECARFYLGVHPEIGRRVAIKALAIEAALGRAARARRSYRPLPPQKSQVSVWIGLGVLGVLALVSATVASRERRVDT